MIIFILTGLVGQDPELKYIPSGTAVCTISLATDVPVKDGKYETQWTKCTFWGKAAESISKHVRKGDALSVSGRPKVEAWISGKTNEPTGQINLQVDRWQFVKGAGSKKEERPGENEPRRRENPDPIVPEGETLDLDEDVGGDEINFF